MPTNAVIQRRRRHSAEFKAEAVAACRQPGVSIASVALARGLNPNLLRRWMVEAEQGSAMAEAIPSYVPGNTAPQHFLLTLTPLLRRNPSVAYRTVALLVILAKAALAAEDEHGIPRLFADALAQSALAADYRRTVRSNVGAQ